MSNGNLNNMNNVQNVNVQTANVNSANIHSAGVPAAAIMQAANAQIPATNATNHVAPQIASPAQAEQQIQSHQLQALLSQLSTSQLASSQVPETQFSSTATQLGQSNVIPETPSSIGSATPMSTPSPHNPASPGIAALIGPDIAQALMQGLTGSSDQHGGKGGRRFPCRSCIYKAFGHSWPKCPSLNVVNVIISLISSKKEQYDRDSNVKRVSEALAKLGVDPTALGVNLERNQGQPQHASPSGGANAQLESAIMAALTGSGSASTMAPPTPSPITHIPACALQGIAARWLSAHYKTIARSIARAMARGLGFVTPCPNKQGKNAYFSKVSDTCTTGAQHRTLKERPILSGYRWQF